VNEKEAKFMQEINGQVIRALRAGASIPSIKLVLEIIIRDMDKAEPYVRAIYEKDLAP
jgi:hypothetical protein